MESHPAQTAAHLSQGCHACGSRLVPTFDEGAVSSSIRKMRQRRRRWWAGSAPSRVVDGACCTTGTSRGTDLDYLCAPDHEGRRGLACVPDHAGYRGRCAGRPTCARAESRSGPDQGGAHLGAYARTDRRSTRRPSMSRFRRLNTSTGLSMSKW